MGIWRKQAEDCRGKRALARARFSQNTYHLAPMYLKACMIHGPDRCRAWQRIRDCQIDNLDKVVVKNTSQQAEIENSTSSKWSYRPSPRNSWTKAADNDRYRQTTVSKLPLQSSSAPGSTHY